MYKKQKQGFQSLFFVLTKRDFFDILFFRFRRPLGKGETHGWGTHCTPGLWREEDGSSSDWRSRLRRSRGGLDGCPDRSAWARSSGYRPSLEWEPPSAPKALTNTTHPSTNHKQSFQKYWSIVFYFF